MPALDLKDEMRGSSNGSSPMDSFDPMESMGPQMNSIQIVMDEPTQKTLVEVVLDDYQKAKADRGKKDYGITSKGEKLNFDEWFKRIKDMYNGNRQPKTIPCDSVAASRARPLPEVV